MSKQSSLLAGLQPEVDETTLIAESLNSIEAILKAESKRRMEANHITEDYIKNYLDGLEKNLTQRVTSQFQALEKRIQSVDQTLSNIENQFGLQEREIEK